MSLGYAPLDEIKDPYYEQDFMKKHSNEKAMQDVTNFNNMHGIPLTGYENYMAQYLGSDFESPLQKEHSHNQVSNREKYTRKPVLSEHSNKLKKVEHFNSSHVDEDYLEDLTEDSKCIKLIKHLSKCKKCRNLLQKKFPKTTQQKDKEEILDVTIYILTGGFTLLLLDLLMKLKK